MSSRSAFGSASNFPMNDRRRLRHRRFGSNVELVRVGFQEKKLDHRVLILQWHPELFARQSSTAGESVGFLEKPLTSMSP